MGKQEILNTSRMCLYERNNKNVHINTCKFKVLGKKNKTKRNICFRFCPRVKGVWVEY